MSNRPVFRVVGVCFVLFVMLISMLLNVNGVGYAVSSAESEAIIGPVFSIHSLDNEQYRPAIAYNWKHREYLVVWENVWGGGGHDIYAQRVSESGELLSWFYVPSDDFSQGNKANPDVAYDPVEDRYLVVWSAQRGISTDIMGRFIPWQGPDPFLTDFFVASSSTTNDYKPKVAFARGETPMQFMVVYMAVPVSGSISYIEYANIKADDGTALKAYQVAAQDAKNRDYPNIAYSTSNNTFFAVWMKEYTGVDYDIAGMRFQGDGDVIGAEFEISGYTDYEGFPAVAACSEAQQFLVAWQSENVESTTNYNLYARFFQDDGTAGDYVTIEKTTAHESEPQVACNMSGKQYMLVYQQQYSNLTGPYGVGVKIINADGSAQSAIDIHAPHGGITDFATFPAVAGGYHNYLTAWEQDRDGTAFQDIYGSLISPYGVFLPMLTK